METIYTDKKEVACDGGILGHPMVYLNMESANEIVCPYCSKKFIYQKAKVAK